MKRMGILLLVVVMSLLSACGGEKPDTAVTNGLNAVKALDTKTMQTYFSAEDTESVMEDNFSESDGQEETLKKLLGKMEFSITQTKEDGDKAVVITEITSIDMKKLMGEFMKNAFGLAFSGLSEEELDVQMQQMLDNLLNREDNETITTTIDIQLEKEDGGWKIELSEELLDAMLGGFVSYGEGISGAFDDASEDDSDTSGNTLSDLQSWLIADIWNDGFCNISHFIYDGTDSTGSTMDIDFTLKQLDKAMEKKSDYDAQMVGLTDAQYTDLKEIWAKLSPEIDRLYNQLQTTKPVEGDSGYDFDLGLYKQYSDAFDKEIDNLE